MLNKSEERLYKILKDYVLNKEKNPHYKEVEKIALRRFKVKWGKQYIWQVTESLKRKEAIFVGEAPLIKFNL